MIVAAVFAFVFCFLPFSANAEPSSHSIESSASISYEKPASINGLGTYAAYELSLIFLPSEKLKIGFGVSIANSSVAYDLIGSTGYNQIHLHSFEGMLGFRLVEFGSVDVDAMSRFGLMVLSSDERMISTGGFGSIRIPGRTENLFVCSVGTIVSKHLASRLTIFVSPKLTFVSPVQLASAGYSIQGGLSIGIL